MQQKSVEESWKQNVWLNLPIKFSMLICSLNTFHSIVDERPNSSETKLQMNEETLRFNKLKSNENENECASMY